ncbi:hypothetical protein EUB02_20975, partial [Mycobacterium tuberculosis]
PPAEVSDQRVSGLTGAVQIGQGEVMQAPHALTMREAPATLRAHFYVRHLGCCCESCWAAPV